MRECCELYVLFCQFMIGKPEEREEHFLSHTQERTLLRFYELQLRDFCRRFTPSMPRATVATALHYFKRFYLRNSVMDYHPKEILVTCVYLACKVIILSSNILATNMSRLLLWFILGRGI